MKWVMDESTFTTLKLNKITNFIYKVIGKRRIQNTVNLLRRSFAKTVYG